MSKATEIHFNRLAMQKNQNSVWQVFADGRVLSAETVQIRLDGDIIMSTAYSPHRVIGNKAWIETKGKVSQEDGIVIIDL